MAIEGALEAERSIFHYKSFQAPHFATKKEKKGSFLGKFSLSSF